MTPPCPRQSCTVDATGICLINYEPASQCPERLMSAQRTMQEGSADALEPAVGPGETSASEIVNLSPALDLASDLQAPPPTKRSLSPGRELGLDALARLARRRPVRLIGLLGSPDAGKTMALVSMYLLAAKNQLTGYEYRNSESGFAFDELSKGLRAWSEDGKLLDQLVPHTALANERQPGFLHLRLNAHALGTAVDLAFPDLPGEWTSSLITRGRYDDRLTFLRNADVIWIFVDGEKLADMAQGHDVAARTCSLIGRLALKLGRRVPLKLVLTRADQFKDVPSQIIDQITDEAADKGFSLELHPIISVDRKDNVRSGDGIAKLLDDSIRAAELGAAGETARSSSQRQILRYRAIRRVTNI